MKKRKEKRVVNQGIISLNQEIDSQQAFFDLILTMGLEAFHGQIDEEIIALCGERYKNLPKRQFTRWSTTNSEIILGGRKVTVRHLRVRDLKNRHDMPLKIINEAKNLDLLQDRQLENMIIGVSTRKYKRSLEGQNVALRGYGIAKSSVSRNFIAKTERMLTNWMNSPITKIFPIIMIDGIQFRKTIILIALGIDLFGEKMVLGMKAGSTENSRVCLDMLNELENRGLGMEAVKLAVIDGSTALRKAVREKFGSHLAVQRCQEHKIRNVLDYLPDEKKETIRYSLREAYNMKDYNSAHNHLCGIIKNLEKEYSSAASSLKEGLEETLTLHKYDVSSSLRKSLRSTNVIENLMGTIRHVSRRVKRWKGEKMALRWAFTGVYEAQKTFRRINGYTKIQKMVDNINNFDKIGIKTA